MVLSSEVFPVEESDAAVQDPMKSFTRRLKELLHTRLTECGWKDQLKAYCKGWYSGMSVYQGLEKVL
ncbi:hypothetical protein V5799_018361 [Amblyomma americanum]|uniref:Uncharacterized protein n=1 Tax=Amblyomma americanum TaxID=6943 RepID=A0AAQ4F0P2_AMBAM